MRILGIESSCDDTSVALLEVDANSVTVLAQKTASQVDIHKKYGGVIPEIAGRLHAEQILPVVDAVLADQPKPDLIAVTSGPGLITGLLVGVEVGKSLAYLWNTPLIGTNHILGHILSPLLKPIGEIGTSEIQFPALALVVSGGHTELVLMENYTSCRIIGRTRDDAAGECFDKVASLLNLPYPGGPKVSKMAQTGDVEAIHFPRPMLDSDNYDFSFAGLKTSALYWTREYTFSNTDKGFFHFFKKIFGYQKNTVTPEDFCASIEQAIVDVLVGKTVRAIKEFHPKTILLGGGVSANKKLRETLASECQSLGAEILIPHLTYAMDNGAMIALAGYHLFQQKKNTDWHALAANPVWRVDEIASYP